jgi:transcriptional regulator with XRE-family HTH domain
MFKKLGQRIRKVRMEHGVKQKDLAKTVGISQGALTNFELGRRKISLEWIFKIAKALDVPVCYLLGVAEPAAGGDLAPKEHRLVRAYRRVGRDPRLQTDLLTLIERVGHHVDRPPRAGRSAAL